METSFQETSTGIDQVMTPAKNAGYQCSLFPNPSSSKFIIDYNLPVLTDVKIEIYSMQGVLFKSISQKDQIEGTHQLAIDTNSAQLATGAYMVIFMTNSFNKSLLLNIIK